MKSSVRSPWAPRRSRARAITLRTSSMRAETADSSSKVLPEAPATIRAIVVFPTPGGPWRISEGVRPSSIARRNADPGPSTCCCPTSSSSVVGRTRCGRGATAAARPTAASLKRSLIVVSILPAMPARSQRTCQT